MNVRPVFSRPVTFLFTASINIASYHIAKNVGGRNICKFGKLMVNRKSFLPQIYVVITSVAISLVGHSPKFK